MKCKNCGANLEQDELTCPSCGTQVENDIKKSYSRTFFIKTAAFVLFFIAIFVLCFGVYNFFFKDEMIEDLKKNKIIVDNSEVIKNNNSLPVGQNEVTTQVTTELTTREETTTEEATKEETRDTQKSKKNPDKFDQKVEVVVEGDGSYGKMTLYQWSKKSGEWTKVKGCSDWDCTVGEQGISSDFGEEKKVSPKGQWNLGVALVDSGSYTGKYQDVYGVTYNTGIIDDVNSAFYNCIVEDNRAHKDPSGLTILSGTCSALIMIECNGDGRSNEGVVSGKGSAITICGVNGQPSPTYGCVDITGENMMKLLDVLDEKCNPVIIIKKI